MQDLPYLSMELWGMVLSDCDPKTLVTCRSACKLFHEVLKNPVIWNASRNKFFGPGCPPPPPNMNDPQYAELTQGLGCQVRTCPNTRVRKIYWALQMRLCVPCFQLRFCPYKDLEFIFGKYPGLRECLVPFRHVKGGRYDGMRYIWGDRSHGYDWHKVILLTTTFVSVDGNVDQNWHNGHVAMITALTNALKICETFFQLWSIDEETRRNDRKQELMTYLENCAAQMEPPLSADNLLECASFQKVIARHRTASHVTIWNRLAEKIQAERSDLMRSDSSEEDLDEDIRTLNRLGDDLEITPPARSTHGDEDEDSGEEYEDSDLEDDEISEEDDDGIEDEPITNATFEPGRDPMIDPRLYESMTAGEPPVNQDMMEEQPTTAPYAVMVSSRGTDETFSLADGSSTLPATNTPDNEPWRSEENEAASG
ncbi:hypothetical protein MMC11_003810 [Xylographa trunciseda]|nr:hypothetical protein [Xylographa trunciseda]